MWLSFFLLRRNFHSHKLIYRTNHRPLNLHITLYVIKILWICLESNIFQNSCKFININGTYDSETMAVSVRKPHDIFRAATGQSPTSLSRSPTRYRNPKATASRPVPSRSPTAVRYGIAELSGSICCVHIQWIITWQM